MGLLSKMFNLNVDVLKVIYLDATNNRIHFLASLISGFSTRQFVFLLELNQNVRDGKIILRAVQEIKAVPFYRVHDVARDSTNPIAYSIAFSNRFATSIGVMNSREFEQSDYAKYGSPNEWQMLSMTIVNESTSPRSHTESDIVEEIGEKIADILDDFETKFSPELFTSLREQIEADALRDKEQIIKDVQAGIDVRQIICATIANVAGDELESGRHHMYRGTFNPMKQGDYYYRLYLYAIEKLVSIGYLTDQKAAEEKNAMRKIIQGIG